MKAIPIVEGLVVPAQVTLHRLLCSLLCMEDDVICEGRSGDEVVIGRAQIARRFLEP